MNMRELRKGNGLTQQQLAEALGERNTTISNWEKGVSTPSVKDLIGISMFYGISMDALVSKGLAGQSQSRDKVVERDRFVTRAELASVEERIAKIEAAQRVWPDKLMKDEVNALLQEALAEAFAPREHKQGEKGKGKKAG